MNWTLEVVTLPVRNIDAAVTFYRDKVGFHLDDHIANEPLEIAHPTRVRLLGSGCSVVIGNQPAQQAMAPGSMKGLHLIVADGYAARQELIDRGVECDEITVFDERDGATFFGFADPDGNTWAVQQIAARASIDSGSPVS